MHVTSLSGSVSILGPTKCKGPRRARRTAAVATVIGASCLFATGSGITVQHARLLSQRQNVAIYNFQNRLHNANGAPRHVFSTNLLLASSAFDFYSHLSMSMSSQDSMLAPVLMRNAPAAVACFAINALAWGILAYRSRFEANEGRTLAVFAASCAAQTSARCVLSLTPMAAPWRMVSGAVFGLLGAKLVYDIRHRRLSVLHQSWMEQTTDTPAPQGSGLPSKVITEHIPISGELSYVDCASHIVCAAAACMMPTHPWCKAAALCGGALTAYLLGPHCIVGRYRCRVTRADVGGDSNVSNMMDYICDYEYVEDRPLVPWFAFPTDPSVSGLGLTPSRPQAKLSILDLDNFAECVGKAEEDLVPELSRILKTIEESYGDSSSDSSSDSLSDSSSDS